MRKCESLVKEKAIYWVTKKFSSLDSLIALMATKKVKNIVRNWGKCRAIWTDTKLVSVKDKFKETTRDL